MPRKKGDKDLSPFTKGRIIGMAAAGKTFKEISNELKISYSAAFRFAARHANQGETTNRKNCGRRRKTTPATDQDIVHQAEATPFNTSRQIIQTMDLDISGTTLRRRLRENGIRPYWSASKPAITDGDCQARLAFARRYENWTADDWKRAIFMDESTAQSFSNAKKRVFRRKNTRLDPDFVSENKSSGRFSIPLYGCFCATGPGQLFRIEGRLNHEKYIAILKKNLPAFLERFPPSTTVFVLQDNCSIHKANATMDFLRRQASYDIIDFPPRSPDMNPIENAWSELKKRIDYTGLRDADHLWERIQTAWLTMALTMANYWQTLSGSMPNRIKQVIKAGGHHTKY